MVLRALLLISTSKTRHRFHLCAASSWHWVGVEILEEECLLTTMQEGLQGVVVEGLLSEGPANEAEVKEEDGETWEK